MGLPLLKTDKSINRSGRTKSTVCCGRTSIVIVTHCFFLTTARIRCATPNPLLSKRTWTYKKFCQFKSNKILGARGIWSVEAVKKADISKMRKTGSDNTTRSGNEWPFRTFTRSAHVCEMHIQRMSSQLRTAAIIIARYCAAKLQHLGFPSGLTLPPWHARLDLITKMTGTKLSCRCGNRLRRCGDVYRTRGRRSR